MKNKKLISLQTLSLKKLIIALMVLFVGTNLNGQSFTQIGRVLYPGDSTNLKFNAGEAIDVDGDYMVVGEPGNSDDNLPGAAYVYYYNGSAWELKATLLPSVRNKNDEFGGRVGISGDNIVIGDYNNAAYIFSKPQAGWKDATETAKLTPATSVSAYGNSVSIFEDVVAVGATYGNNSKGEVYIYKKPVSGWVSTTSHTALIRTSDGQSYDKFGNTVSIDSTTLLVGADGDKDNGDGSGSAYIYNKPVSGWATTSTADAKLLPSDGTTYGYFGRDIKITGDYAVVGSWGADNNLGAVYVFEKPVNGWANATETAKLSPNKSGQSISFGWNVDAHGDNIVIGTRSDDTAYVFTKPVSGWASATETAIVSDATLGSYSIDGGVAIHGNHLLVGAPRYDGVGKNSGAVLAYKKNGATWTSSINPDARIYSPVGLNINTESYFGEDVAIDGNYAVVAAYNAGKNQEGKVYVMELSNGVWTTIAQLAKTGAVSSDNLGSSVAIFRDIIVVGASSVDNKGAVYVYKKPVSGWKDMTETAILTASSRNDQSYFGGAVSIDGDNIVVGASNDHATAGNSGAAYVFVKPVSGWSSMTETAKLSASDGEGYDRFGETVAISGENIVVGASSDDDGGGSAGAAYVFTKPVSGWATMTETGKLTASNGSGGHLFGQHVGISGNDIVSTAPNSNNGTAYVFTKPVSGWTTMTETAKLNVTQGIYSGNYGRHQIDFSGDTVAVSATGALGGPGAVFVYYKPAGGWIDTTESAIISSSSNSNNLRDFGRAVALDGDNMIVGSQGDTLSVFFFQKSIASSLLEQDVNTNEITLYPNPAQNVLHISSSNQLEIHQVVLRNVLGQTEMIITNNNSIDLSVLTSGVYFVQVSTNKGIINKSFVKK